MQGRSGVQKLFLKLRVFKLLSMTAFLLSAPIYLLYFTFHSESLILRSCIHIDVAALPQQCSPSCEISGLSLQNSSLTPALSQVPVAPPT